MKESIKYSNKNVLSNVLNGNQCSIKYVLNSLPVDIHKDLFDKEPSHGLINANQQKTEVIDGKLSKSYQVYQLHSRNWRTFFNVVVTNVLSQEDIQEIQDSAPALGGIWLQLLKNSTRILAPLSLAEKNKDVFRLFPPTDKECAKLVGFPPGQSILQ